MDWRSFFFLAINDLDKQPHEPIRTVGEAGDFRQKASCTLILHLTGKESCSNRKKEYYSNLTTQQSWIVANDNRYFAGHTSCVCCCSC